MTKHKSFMVPEYIFEWSTLPIETREYKSIVVPANVIDCEMFKQAMIVTQFDAIEKEIRERHKKVLIDLSFCSGECEFNRLNERSYKLKKAYNNICDFHNSTLDGLEIEIRDTIAELLSFVVFPCCKGSKEYPLIPKNAPELYHAAIKARESMSSKAVNDFRGLVIEFIDLHTSADERSGFAKAYENRISHAAGHALLLDCLGVRLKYSKNGITSSQNNIQEFTEQVILTCLKKIYKV